MGVKKKTSARDLSADLITEYLDDQMSIEIDLEPYSIEHEPNCDYWLNLKIRLGEKTIARNKVLLPFTDFVRKD